MPETGRVSSDVYITPDCLRCDDSGAPPCNACGGRGETGFGEFGSDGPHWCCEACNGRGYLTYCPDCGREEPDAS